MACLQSPSPTQSRRSLTKGRLWGCGRWSATALQSAPRGSSHIVHSGFLTFDTRSSNASTWASNTLSLA
eukprot:4130859-Amphidinium_carterae.2